MEVTLSATCQCPDTTALPLLSVACTDTCGTADDRGLTLSVCTCCWLLRSSGNRAAAALPQRVNSDQPAGIGIPGLVSMLGLGARTPVMIIDPHGVPVLSAWNGAGIPDAAPDAPEVPISGLDPQFPTLTQASDGGIARQLVKSGIRPALIVAGDLVMRRPDLDSTLEFLASLGGVLSFEINHLGAALNTLALDRLLASPQPAISLVALEPRLAAVGLTLFEAIPCASGRLHLLACPVDEKRAERPGLPGVRATENALQLGQVEGFRDVATRLNGAISQFAEFFASARYRRRRVAAVGSEASAELIVSALCLERGDIACLAVPSVAAPGGISRPSEIPLCSLDRLRDERPDFVLILPGADQAQVMTELGCLRHAGTCFVTGLPDLIVSA